MHQPVPKKVLIFLGPPGSGKGTQAKQVAEQFGWGYVSTGDLLRALAGKSNLSPHEIEAVELMKAGKLVNDQLIFDLVFDTARHFFASGKGVVFDGAIRNELQAKKYQEFFVSEGLSSEVRVIDIELTDEEAAARLGGRRVCESCATPVMAGDPAMACPKCGGRLVMRGDDAREVIEARLKVQGNAALEPIREYYRGLGVLRAVNGYQSIEAVGREVTAAICS